MPPKGKEPLKHTPLYDVHVKLGAKMVEFGDWEMPVRYSTIRDEHRAVREAAGLFDVSHMGQITLEGPGALAVLQRLTTNDVSRLNIGDAQYTIMTTYEGTCIDDLIITRTEEEKFLLVVNASNIKKDCAWLTLHSFKGVIVKDISPHNALLALQGPRAQEILDACTGDETNGMKPFTFRRIVLAGGMSAEVSRTGYTGEDGFEIMVNEHDAMRTWNLLLEEGGKYGLVPCGLGARDTLRLEAGLALYGHDLDAEHTPLEAQLRRFVKLDKQTDFFGKERLLKQQTDASHDLLVGLVLEGKGVAREEFNIQNEAGEMIGKITSGGPAPTLGTNIALGYVLREYAEIDTELLVVIRDTLKSARVVKTPFYRRKKRQKGARP